MWYRMGRKSICVYCGDKHHVNECGKIGEIEDYNEKRKIYWDKYLCYGCGMKGDRDHSIRNCKNRAVCKICKKRHPTCLHDKNRDKSDQVQTMSTEVCESTSSYAGVEQSLIVPVYVRSGSNPENTFECYCILDGQSTASFITDELATNLGLSGQETQILLSTMSKENEVVSTKKYRDLGGGKL